MTARKWWVHPEAKDVVVGRTVILAVEDLGIKYSVSKIDADSYGIDVWCDDDHIGVADSMAEAAAMARDDAKGMM